MQVAPLLCAYQRVKLSLQPVNTGKLWSCITPEVRQSRLTIQKVLIPKNFQSSSGWYIRMFEDGNLSFCVTRSSWAPICTPSIAVPPDKFTHIGTVFDGSMVSIYNNGNLGAESRFAGEYVADPATPLKIGGIARSGESSWSGIIDDLGI